MAIRSLETLYETIGGLETCRRLSTRFHNRVEADPVLRPLFPGRELTKLIEHLALFLAQRLGGPADYTAQRGKQSLVCRHAHLPIGGDEGARWLGHMHAAMQEIGLPENVQALLGEYFIETAGTLADPLLPFYHLPIDRLRVLLEEDSAPATLADHGRTLLRMAAREWDLERVRLLLEFGANVLARDALGHPALYHAANAQLPGRPGDGRALVALLIERGAEVNARSGPGRMTALHMAARRGSVDLAEALLAAGAEIEAKDSKGETPLRRAVNCGQKGMVRLLMAHGADPLSADKRGRTPRDAARNKTLRQALENE